MELVIYAMCLATLDSKWLAVSSVFLIYLFHFGHQAIAKPQLLGDIIYLFYLSV